MNNLDNNNFNNAEPTVPSVNPVSQNPELENLKELGGTTIPSGSEEIFTINIIGQIEGHNILPPQSKATRYEHVIPQLIAVEQNPTIKGVLVVLNTVGGDVEAGLAIAEMLNSITKPSVSLVIGGSHSIGVPLAVSTDYSYISPTATMIIHPVRMNGLVIGAPQTFEYFNKMQDRISNFITRNSQISPDKLRCLMMQTDELMNDMGTILIGHQATEIGLIKEVGGIGEALSKLKQLIDEKKEV
ncbi:ATP-dependent Clp protease proteolytic subunit [Clostridium cylindrosporum]|uniref:ClpP family protease n=1 Tax=Clostridium cylindrosporum TaxID=1495 RepID=UPI0009E54661